MTTPAADLPHVWHYTDNVVWWLQHDYTSSWPPHVWHYTDSVVTSTWLHQQLTSHMSGIIQTVWWLQHDYTSSWPATCLALYRQCSDFNMTTPAADPPHVWHYTDNVVWWLQHDYTSSWPPHVWHYTDSVVWWLQHDYTSSWPPHVWHYTDSDFNMLHQQLTPTCLALYRQCGDFNMTTPAADPHMSGIIQTVQCSDFNMTTPAADPPHIWHYTDSDFNMTTPAADQPHVWHYTDSAVWWLQHDYTSSWPPTYLALYRQCSVVTSTWLHQQLTPTCLALYRQWLQHDYTSSWPPTYLALYRQCSVVTSTWLHQQLIPHMSGIIQTVWWLQHDYTSSWPPT